MYVMTGLAAKHKHLHTHTHTQWMVGNIENNLNTVLYEYRTVDKADRGGCIHWLFTHSRNHTYIQYTITTDCSKSTVIQLEIGRFSGTKVEDDQREKRENKGRYVSYGQPKSLLILLRILSLLGNTSCWYYYLIRLLLQHLISPVLFHTCHAQICKPRGMNCTNKL